MRGCMSLKNFVVLVNENVRGWLKATKGLRQGDPLSTFLFR